jgi:hypothetical protein
LLGAKPATRYGGKLLIPLRVERVGEST